MEKKTNWGKLSNHLSGVNGQLLGKSCASLLPIVSVPEVSSDSLPLLEILSLACCLQLLTIVFSLLSAAADFFYGIMQGKGICKGWSAF